MKKNIIFLLMVSIVIFSSCTTKKEVVIPNITVITDIKPSDWQYRVHKLFSTFLRYRYKPIL